MKIIPLIILIFLTACASPKTLITGQAINYTQIDYVYNTPGWHEKSDHINDIHDEFGMLGVAAWKAGTTVLILKLADWFPKHKDWIIGASNCVVWGFVFDDYFNNKVGFSITIKR